jgi:hypothetical protein
MTGRAAVSQAKMDRMRRAIVRAGLPFRGFKTLPDGSVEALVGEPEPLTTMVSHDVDPLEDELAAYRAKHGYG